MKTNTHSLKMHGLRAAAGDTRLAGQYGRYVQISYDRDTGDVLSDYFCGTTGNWRKYYNDPAVVDVCFAESPMTMQQIADAIAEAVEFADMAAEAEKF